jgi:hypothetical protein
MLQVHRPGLVARSFGLAMLLLIGSGCQLEDSLEAYGVSLALPSGWVAEPRTTWPVPGDPLAAWSWGKGSLVVYRGLPIPGGTAEAIAESLANRLTNLPEMRVERKTTETLDGQRFARVEVVAPGTGAALAPTGIGRPVAPDGQTLIPTRRVTLGFVRGADTLYLTWHAPESEHERLEEQIDRTLRGLKVAPSSQSSSSY